MHVDLDSKAISHNSTWFRRTRAERGERHAKETRSAFGCSRTDGSGRNIN